MKETIPYTCPRCEYKSLRRADILRHFNRVKPCPCANDHQLQLTNEIKEIVVRDRIYYIKKERAPVVHNINNIMSNYFNGPLDKIQALAEYRNTKMIPLDRAIEEKYFETKQKYDKNSNIYYNKLTIDGLLQILDELSLSSDPEYRDLNILYDRKQNKLSYIEDDGKWKVSLVDKGLGLLVEKIKDNFLNYYECYLIRQIIKDNAQIDLLKEYYKFLSVFHIEPITFTSDDSVILENDDYDKYTCKAKFYAVYCETKGNITNTERNRIRRQMIDVIKRNSVSNEDRLSMDIHNIFVQEEEFKKFLNGFGGKFIDGIIIP